MKRTGIRKEKGLREMESEVWTDQCLSEHGGRLSRHSLQSCSFITKRCTRSLFIGVAVGAMLYSGFNPWESFVNFLTL